MLNRAGFLEDGAQERRTTVAPTVGVVSKAFCMRLQLVRRAPIIVVALACLGFGSLYLFLDLNKLHALYYGQDSGIFLQMLARFAHDGSTFNWYERRPHLWVHDSWILLVLAPLVQTFPYQETLIAVQVLVVAGSAVVLYYFACVIGVARTPATLLAVAYLISPSVQAFAYNDFSESYFEPIFIFAFSIALYRRSFPLSLLLAQVLLGIKEDIALFMIWFGIIGAIWWDRPLSICIALLAIINAAVWWILPIIYGYHRWGPTYPSPPNLTDLAFLIEILVPFAFAPLFLGWRTLIALPLLGELFLAYYPGNPLARAGVHATAPLISLLAIATAFALRDRPQIARWALLGSCLMALCFNTTVLHIGRHLYRPDPRYEATREVGTTHLPIVYSQNDFSLWSVAAADINARIIRGKLTEERPAWNTK